MRAQPTPGRCGFAAKAAAAAGFAAVYLEPSQAPGEAAARLKGLLQRHAASLGLDTTHRLDVGGRSTRQRTALRSSQPGHPAGHARPVGRSP